MGVGAWHTAVREQWGEWLITDCANTGEFHGGGHEPIWLGGSVGL